MISKDKEIITLRVSEKLKNQISEIADEKEQTVSSLIRLVLLDYIKAFETLSSFTTKE